MTRLEVILADNHLLAVVKPAGLPTVPDESGDESLFERAREWVRERGRKPGNVFLGVVHRLDRPVSGVVLFARTSKAAARLSAAWRERRVQKTYWGLGRGRPAHDTGILEQWLEKDAAKNVARVVRPGHGRPARTRWRLLDASGGIAWLELRPETGRPHQLRLAARALGCPLLGDLKYGAREPLADRSVALHAWRLELLHPVRRQPLDLRAPVPELEVWDRCRRAGTGGAP